jgi:hypothetical protein
MVLPAPAAIEASLEPYDLRLHDAVLPWMAAT